MPVPLLLTAKVVVPASLETGRSAGVTDRIDCVTTEKLPVWLIGPFIVIVVDFVAPL